MIEWVLSFVPWWAWLAGGVVAAGAAWPYLGLRGAVAIVFVATTWTAYLGGVAHERGRGEVAGLKAELAIARDDIDKAKRAETDASARAAALAASDQLNQDVVKGIERDYPPEEPIPDMPPAQANPNPADGAPPVAPAPAARACRCVATDADLRRLRELR